MNITEFEMKLFDSMRKSSEWKERVLSEFEQDFNQTVRTDYLKYKKCFLDGMDEEEFTYMLLENVDVEYNVKLMTLFRIYNELKD